MNRAKSEWDLKRSLLFMPVCFGGGRAEGCLRRGLLIGRPKEEFLLDLRRQQR